jgi:hypothetical protein
MVLLVRLIYLPAAIIFQPVSAGSTGHIPVAPAIWW